MPVAYIRCRHCHRKVRANRAVKGMGADCAAQHGLLGTAPDTGHDGPDLLDLLTPDGDASSANTT